MLYEDRQKQQICNFCKLCITNRNIILQEVSQLCISIYYRDKHDKHSHMADGLELVMNKR